MLTFILLVASVASVAVLVRDVILFVLNTTGDAQTAFVFATHGDLLRWGQMSMLALCLFLGAVMLWGAS